MANLNFTHSDAPLKIIQEIQFGLLSPEEIKSMSVAHILYPETMDDSRMKPRESGLNDPRLGSIDRQFKCATCDQQMAECPGHFGHIELAKPVFHPGFIKKIKKILEMVCHNCGKILLDRVSVPIEHGRFICIFVLTFRLRVIPHSKQLLIFETPNVDSIPYGDCASQK